MSAQRGIQQVALEAWLRFVLGESHVLSERPTLLPQQALSQPRRTPVGEAADWRLAAGGWPARPWLRRLNRAEHASPALLTLVAGPFYLPIPARCAVSPDGRTVAASIGQPTISLWDTESGQRLGTLAPHGAPVVALAFSDDGSMLVSLTEAGELVNWDVHTHSAVASAVAFPGKVWCAALSLDGRVAAAYSGESGVLVRSTEPEAPSLALGEGGPRVTALAFASDSGLLLTGDEAGDVVLWEVATGRRRRGWHAHEGEVTVGAFASDGVRLATGGGDNSIAIWEVGTGAELLRTRDQRSLPRALAFSADGGRLAAGWVDRTVRVWEPLAPEPISTLVGHTFNVTSCAFLFDRGRLVSASPDGTVRLWSVGAGAAGADEPAAQGALRDLDVSADGERVATVGNDGSARLWAAAGGAPVATLVEPERAFGVTCCRFSPDGRELAVARELGEGGEWEIELRDAATLDPLATLAGHQDEVVDGAFSPDGRSFVSIESFPGRLLLHDLAKEGEPPRELFRHPKWVSRCGWSPDGVCVLTGGVDGIRVWEAASGALVAQFGKQGPLAGEWAFLPGTSRLVAQSDSVVGSEQGLLYQREGDLVLYEIEPVVGRRDAATPRWRLRAQATLARPGADARAYFAASPDGRRVAATLNYGDDRGWLGIWDVENGELVATAPCRGQSPCTFSPCGRWIAVRSIPWLHVHAAEDARLAFSYRVGLFLALRWCGPNRLALGDSGGRLHLLRLEGAVWA